MTSPDRHTDVRSKRTLTTRPPCLVGTTTVGGISELAVRSASGVNIVITCPRSPEVALCSNAGSLPDRITVNS